VIAQWYDSTSLRDIWERLPYSEAPFTEWIWWEQQSLPWGAVVVSEEKPIAAIPFAVRRIGPLRLYRQPLSVPELGIRLAKPLPLTLSEKYQTIARILRALREWIARTHLIYVGGALSAEWSYLPPLYGLTIRAHGSFILEPGTFAPDKDLLRKLRQAEALPVRILPPQEAFQWWVTHRPVGVSPKLQRHLAPLMSYETAWHALGVGEPLQAVGLFLQGVNRIWYIAGAHTPKSGQAGVRLLYEAIQWAHAQGKVFDFHGSVLPGVERFFRQFGGRWEVRYALAAWRF